MCSKGKNVFKVADSHLNMVTPPYTALHPENEAC